MNTLVLALLALLPLAPDSIDEAQTAIVAAYSRAFDAMNRGDADLALQMDTVDWVSITVGQEPRSRQEMEPLIRRDIAGMKAPSDWEVVWKPDYEHTGTGSGIQLYDLKRTGDSAVVLCLVGSTHIEKIQGRDHRIWVGSHVRDTWVRTPTGWKRRLHEKLTVNERMIDGRPA